MFDFLVNIEKIVLVFFEDACVKRMENEAENYARLWRIVLKHDQ